MPGRAQQRVRAAAVLVREGRAGEVDARHADYDTTMDTEFVALGHAGSEHYAGLETFPNPGVGHVDMTSDELSAMCPITGQPDFYTAKIEYWPSGLCLESKSLKIYLGTYRNEGAFCEALAVKIRDDVAAALELAADKVRVSLVQKPRGGITITATT
jgi:7-cyano-7-deazaguanine reductase